MEKVTLTIFDLTGRAVAIVYRNHMASGERARVLWDASGVTSGAYVAQLRVGEFSLSRRIVLTR